MSTENQNPSTGDDQSVDKVAAVGNAVWLMTQLPTHKHLFVADLEWMVLPPISLGNFRLWREGLVPVGFATWAMVSEEVEQRLSQGITKLGPNDWDSGDRLWLMDMLFPYGGQDKALEDIKQNVFPDRKMKSLRPKAEGGVEVFEI